MYGFLLVSYSNFVHKMHHFWDIRLQKCSDVENRIKGPWRSLKISPFDRDPRTSYWWSIVTIALSHVVPGIFNVKKYCDLEIPVKSQSRSLKVIPFNRLVSFLLVFYSNFVPKMQRFWDIRLQKCHDLENSVRGPSMSLKMSSFDRAHMTSYWCSIVNMALSLVVSEIFNVKEYHNLEITVRGQSRLMWLMW